MGFLFSPYGRISRKTYWLSWLLPYFFATIAAVALDYAIFPPNPETHEPPPVFQGILALILLWPSIAIATKRLHDRGMTGWWNAAPFIGVVGVAAFAYYYYTQRMAAGGGAGVDAAANSPVGVAVLIGAWVLLAVVVLYPAINILFLKGQAGENKYGADPLGNPADVF